MEFELPPGWYQVYDPVVRSWYYKNIPTGESTWNTPNDVILGTLDSQVDPAAENDPNNWSTWIQEGRIFFFNHVTYTNQWEKPLCLESTSCSFEGEGPPPLSLRIFLQFDRDQSGDIDVSELQTMAYHFGIWLEGPALVTALMIMDSNGDGRVSYPEFKAWYTRSNFQSLKLDDESLERRSSAAVIFRRYDLDQSGSIDQAEFIPMYQEMVEANLVQHDMAQTRAEIDFNQDGKIQFNEFLSWLESKIVESVA